MTVVICLTWKKCVKFGTTHLTTTSLNERNSSHNCDHKLKITYNEEVRLISWMGSEKFCFKRWFGLYLLYFSSHSFLSLSFLMLKVGLAYFGNIALHIFKLLSCKCWFNIFLHANLYLKMMNTIIFFKSKWMCQKNPSGLKESRIILFRGTMVRNSLLWIYCELYI